MQQALKVAFLRERFSHMGQYSGYDRLFSTLEGQLAGTHSIYRQETEQYNPIKRRQLEYLAGKVKGSPFHNITSTGAEWRAFMHLLTQKPRVLHLGYLENHYALLRRVKKYTRTRYVATVHQPAGWWRLRMPEVRYKSLFHNLDGLIVLSRKDAAFFEPYLPGKVHFIPHGVDTAFFKRATGPGNPAFRCLFVGQWLRDIDTLIRLVPLVLRQNPAIQFDIVYPMNQRVEGPLLKLARYEQVHWHSRLSDEGLRALYRQASVLVLPLLDCTANNALLEAMSCGLPVVTTDVGGVRDYVADDFADVCDPDDAGALCEKIIRLALHPEACRGRGERARAHAESHFSWENVAGQVTALYGRVTEPGPFRA